MSQGERHYEMRISSPEEDEALRERKAFLEACDLSPKESGSCHPDRNSQESSDK